MQSLVLTAQTLRFLGLAADTTSSILLTGETGTGKTRLARAIHDASNRDGVFQRFDLSSCPPTLLEAHLFGQEKGAFTDARSARLGVVRATNSGTLLLDEVDSLDYAMQARLLTLCDENKIRALGSDHETPVDVRLIAASNMPLEQLVRERRFRPDLYFRLNVLSHHLPPLRDRDDFSVVCEAVLARVAARARPQAAGITFDDGALDALHDHAWPGNIRELEHVLERAVVAGAPDVLSASMILAAIRPTSVHRTRHSEPHRAPVGGWCPSAGTLRNVKTYRAPASKEDEMEMICGALAAHDQHIRRTAEALGMCRQTLWRKLKAYGLDRRGHSR